MLQAAGRVIRTATDRGVILLLDERFLQGEQAALFPREWADLAVTEKGRVGELLAGFWEGDGIKDG